MDQFMFLQVPGKIHLELNQTEMNNTDTSFKKNWLQSCFLFPHLFSRFSFFLFSLSVYSISFCPIFIIWLFVFILIRRIQEL